MFAFIVDFPLFEWNDDEERWDAIAPPVHVARARRTWRCSTAIPGAVRSNAYDITCNGWEIGSGSIRIHQRESRSGSSSCWASARRRRRRSSGTCWTRSSTARRRTAGFAPGIDRTVALLRAGDGHPRGDRLPEDEERAGPDDGRAAARRPGGPRCGRPAAQGRSRRDASPGSLSPKALRRLSGMPPRSHPRLAWTGHLRLAQRQTPAHPRRDRLPPSNGHGR